MKFSSVSFLAAVFSSPPSTPLFGGSSSVVCIHRLDLQSSRCFSSRQSSSDAPRVIPPSDALPVVTTEADLRGCAPPQCSKKIDDLSLEYLPPSLWASSSSEELNNRHVVTASAIVDAVKKESGREKREGQGRFLGAFSKADSLRETLLERKNKKPRKVRHWKPNEVEEADFNSSTALGRLNSTTSLLGRLGIEPSRTKVDSFAADISGGEPCTKENGEDDVKCNGDYACDGINPDHVGCGSCNADRACFFATGTDIGEESCNEFGACYKTSGAEIEDQSCNGAGACGLSPGIAVEEGSCNMFDEDDYGMCGLASGALIGKESCLGHYGSKIGNGSCHGEVSCFASFDYDEEEEGLYSDGDGGNIGNGSCTFAYSCVAFRGTVGNDSCNTFFACASGQGRVHDGSCGRPDSSDYVACDSMRGRIGKDSCNDIAACVRSSRACVGVNGYEIGSCACNMYEECLCEEGEDGYTCDDSGDVFTNAQESTCKRSAKARKGSEGDRDTASANIFSPED
ncbi:predicted protein [Thalassiosira pseudonana CCMP1335]|uniref:DUF7640 domain-containing protein n=1 Tax=Thalassiosira pseudonana TaxID=35128 RepID=B8CF95_THAPS|nr:predicted protein [Thalassiosira pseudonana CCMP1335]EED87761.1 predicted protein [Thalassiosira pseudonana CCMP1335]